MQLSSLSNHERYDLMIKQIEAFREKVRLCRESYSSRLAESMISQLRAQDGSFIDTIYKLRKYVQTMSTDQQQAPTAVYAVWYLSTLKYLKELKTNFDERIYLPLSKLYQNMDVEEGMTADEQGQKEASTLSAYRAHSSASVLKFKNDLPEVKDLYDFAEVENVATRLKYMRQRWQFLMEEENEINTSLFSYNSQVETSARCPKNIVNLLRVIPDILTKCGKAGLLSLQWLECASTKAIDIQTKYHKLERVRSVLTEKLSGLSTEIKSEERQLEVESTDLEMLADREERANDILSKTHQLESYIKQLHTNIYKLSFQTEELQVKRRSSDLSAKTQIDRQTHKNEAAIFKLSQEIKMKMYEKDLLEEDLAIELEVKPCLIRFTDQIQEKCESLEQEIDKKRNEKQRVESALVPVIADSKRTQAQISRTTSASSTPQNTIVKDSIFHAPRRPIVGDSILLHPPLGPIA